MCQYFPSSGGDPSESMIFGSEAFEENKRLEGECKIIRYKLTLYVTHY